MAKMSFKILSILTTTILLVVTEVFAQFTDTLWTKTYGGASNDRAYFIDTAPHRGYIIVGSTESFGFGKYDVYLIRTDSLGDTLWTKTFGGTDDDLGNSVQTTSDGGFIIAGITKSYGQGNYDVYLIKTDSSGTTLWTKTYGGYGLDAGYSVRQTNVGGYIIAGWTTSFGSGAEDIYLIKTDPSGDTIWTKTYGATSYDNGYSVQQTSDGGYIIAGRIGDNACLIKTDSLGDTLWIKKYGNGCAYSVQQTYDDGYIIAGSTYSSGTGSEDVYLTKTDSRGDTLWTGTYGDWDEDYGFSVQITADGGYIVAGYTGVGEVDFYVVKTDENGNLIWTQKYGSNDYDEGRFIKKTSDGGYIIVGFTTSYGSGGADFYLIKTKPIPQIENFPSLIDVMLLPCQTTEQNLIIKNYGNNTLTWDLNENPSVDWLSGNPTSGSVNIGDSLNIILTFDATGMTQGDYYDTLLISSNDPHNPSVDVKIHLRIIEGEAPQIWINPSSFDFTLKHNQTTNQNLTIVNTKNTTLNWNITESPSVDWLTENPVSGSINPYESFNVLLTFNSKSLYEGNYYDTLLLSSNASNNSTINIPIRLTVLVGEAIFVYPNPFVPKRGHTSLTFANLPDEGTIEVYTISGHLVWKYPFAYIGKLYSWVVRTDKGKYLTSGVYYYVVKNKSGKILKKDNFSVIR